jgi:hypothetical protein
VFYVFSHRDGSSEGIGGAMFVDRTTAMWNKPKDIPRKVLYSQEIDKA